MGRATLDKLVSEATSSWSLRKAHEQATELKDCGTYRAFAPGHKKRSTPHEESCHCSAVRRRGLTSRIQQPYSRDLAGSPLCLACGGPGTRSHPIFECPAWSWYRVYYRHRSLGERHLNMAQQ
eukprot:2030860-Amphidinium_carterae.2